MGRKSQVLIDGVVIHVSIHGKVEYEIPHGMSADAFIIWKEKNYELIKKYLECARDVQ
jgi:hypothetical protein